MSKHELQQPVSTGEKFLRIFEAQKVGIPEKTSIGRQLYVEGTKADTVYAVREGTGFTIGYVPGTTDLFVENMANRGALLGLEAKVGGKYKRNAFLTAGSEVLAIDPKRLKPITEEYPVEFIQLKKEQRDVSDRLLEIAQNPSSDTAAHRIEEDRSESSSGSQQLLYDLVKSSGYTDYDEFVKSLTDTTQIKELRSSEKVKIKDLYRYRNADQTADDITYYSRDVQDYWLQIGD